MLTPVPAAAVFGQPPSRPQQDDRSWLELREYHLPVGPARGRVGDFLRDAAIPAWNRLGIQPVGVFNVAYGATKPSLYVLLPHPTLESVVTTAERLAADDTYAAAAADVLNAPLSDPAYVRIESSLMRAFTHMPRVEPPAGAATGASRIFEMRTYEGHNDDAVRRKMHMFNEAGEIQIFRDTGLTPVFFGETVIGQRMPNLVYMLTFPDMTERDRAWATFSSAPAWRELNAEPFYRDSVSNISDIILRPTAYSQV